jgi:probable rRNA maturation factor
MIVNRQEKIGLNLPRLRTYVRRLRSLLKTGDFNVCFVTDDEIRRMNSLYRAKPEPTDVLSFPWQAGKENGEKLPGGKEFENFLGDIVISAETTERNARAEGHSTEAEIRWLILHGALHLLGYDHETDQGEMTALEWRLRERLSAAAPAGVSRKKRPGRTPINV